MKRNCAVLFILLFSLNSTPSLAQFTGTLKGQVLDQATRQPLPGANILLLDSEHGTITGDDGRFTIPDLPVGGYRLQASMIGYETSIRPDLIVRSNRITVIRIFLAEEILGMEETVVAADYFSAVEEEKVSALNLNYEEIRRSPGSAQDISRLIQAMPSVNMNNDQRNDLIVRGGSPTENLTLIDHIEVPNINHFPTQGASGGPIGLLNVDLIEDANFYAGGFSAAYGDRLSSVLSIDMREGNHHEFDGEANLSMGGAGFIFEGPLSDGRGAWILSARRSYLDLIVGAIGTGAVPEYSDIQGKLSYDLAQNHKLSLLSISSFDHISISPEDQDENDDDVVWDADQHVVGANWQWLWSNSGYATTSLAYAFTNFVMDVANGDTGERLYNNDSQERDLALRSDFYYRFRPGSALSWGLHAKRFFSDFTISAAADTNRLNLPVPEIRIGNDVTTSKIGLYASYEQTLFQRLKATAGLRYDYFAYNEEHDLAPRLALSFDIDDRTSLNAAAGIYYQNLSPSLMVQHPDNRLLENPRADHFVLGLKHRLSPSTQLTLEIYAKNYTQLPYDPDDPTISIVDAYADFGAPTPGRLVGGGKAASKGVEFLLQKKLAQDLYGTFSYAYSVSKYTDLQGIERNRNFDNRHLFSIITGYRPSDRYEFSLRWSYAGGRPYTPFDEELSRQLSTGIIQRDRLNTERLPPYHRLDLRFDYRKHYERFNLVSFFSLLNAYNRSNIFTYYWDDSDNRVDRINQWAFLPVGGFELEF